MAMSKETNKLNWAVVAICTAKNDGRYETFKRTIAVFESPVNAEEFIEKCLPKDNRDKFEVISIYY